MVIRIQQIFVAYTLIIAAVAIFINLYLSFTKIHSLYKIKILCNIIGILDTAEIC